MIIMLAFNLGLVVLFSINCEKRFLKKQSVQTCYLSILPLYGGACNRRFKNHVLFDFDLFLEIEKKILWYFFHNH